MTHTTVAAGQHVQGTCDPRFSAVAEALRARLQSGEELGAGIVVDVDGHVAVDIWGGWRDEACTVPWTSDTIVNLWSTTKPVVVLAALLLVERGQLDVDAPVARYWPEFAANGKQDVLVRHVLSHTSGASGWDAPFALGDDYDLEVSTARLAAQAPWWEPGTASGYHASNLGHLVGEIVRRITGRSLTDFVREEIAEPLGADLTIGAPQTAWPRIADVVPPPPLVFDLTAMDPDSPVFKTLTGPPADAAAANSREWRAAELGARNGHGNARSVARVLSVIARGGALGDLRLLSPKTIESIFREQADGVDLVLGIPIRWGIGFALPHPQTLPYIPPGRRCFWGGWGGSLAVVDVELKMTFTYVMNRMAGGIIGSDRSEAYVRACYDALGVALPD